MAKVEKTQSSFEIYINNLPFTERCKYMGSVFSFVNFCNYTLFPCKFRKREVYKHRGKEFHECERERIKQIKQILGNNKF